MIDIEKKPVVLRNSEGIKAIIVSDFTETKNGNFRCRIKLQSWNYINAIFYKEAYDPKIMKKGVEILIYEIEFVCFNKFSNNGNFHDDFVFFLIKPNNFVVK